MAGVPASQGAIASPRDLCSSQLPLMRSDDELLATNNTLTPEQLREVEQNSSNVASVIQFTCAIYYVTEGDENTMRVDVARLGDAVHMACVDYATKDSSAKAGVKYLPVSGTLLFRPGETLKTVEIPILNNDRWDSTLEFGLTLSNAKGAQLGRYLDACRVTIIDDEAFPTSKYRDAFSGRGLKGPEGVGNASLYLEYLKMCLNERAVLYRVILLLLMSLLKGFYYFMTIYLQVYLIDVVLAGEDEERRLEEGEKPSFMLRTLIVPEERRKTAMVVAVIYVTPVLVLHVIDYSKNYLGLTSRLRKVLQSNLLRKFLYYDEAVRRQLDNEQVTLCLMRDAVEVVDTGFMKIMAVLGILMKLGFALLFIFAENGMATIPLVVMPLIMLSFLTLRERAVVEVNEDAAARQDEVLKCVNESVVNYRLIAEFFLRPWTVDTFEGHLDQYHKQLANANATFTNNLYLAPWLTALLVGGYMVVGSTQVSTVGGPLPLGVFLATINVFKEIGHEMQEIYLECLEVQKTSGPLVKIATYMNLPMDLRQRKDINRMRRAVGEEERQKQRNNTAEAGTGEFPVDRVPLRLEDMSFKFQTSDHYIFNSVSLVLQQGLIHCFVGPANAGKATLLKLLGLQLLPDSDSKVFVPPHLRILHVSQDITILNGSLLWNVVLNQGLEKVGGKERVLKLMEILEFGGLTDRFKKDCEHYYKTGNIVNPEEDGSQSGHSGLPWHSHLSRTSLARISLLRAMVMNPEVLILHKPFVTFEDKDVKSLSVMMRRHVSEKGLELDVDQRSFRRPRTVLFSSTSDLAIRAADHIYKVAKQTLTHLQIDDLAREDVGIRNSASTEADPKT
eukprot:TRINITY_DN82278_c0_g1_i1.p1 TRINITY_DN82278_c0_g1~~TRINITY_DN82278_c0_g1_i1.p1  ORF type:complete len:844 (+),score=118.31 TRINITY_DN82278_c0_g1_i1:75-2606(+)